MSDLGILVNCNNLLIGQNFQGFIVYGRELELKA